MTIQARKAQLIDNALSPATKDARKRHWKCYLRFCATYKFSPIPCDCMQASFYLSFLSLYMKFNSVVTYYQAVVFFHRYFGFSVPLLSDARLRYVMLGIKKDPTSTVRPMEPLFPGHLKKLYLSVNFDIEIQFVLWVAIIVLFRTLLRISHVTVSPHSLRRCDIHFTAWGVQLTVHSAKTSGRGFPRVLPIIRGQSHQWCPVYWLERLCKKFPRKSSDFLFSTESFDGISYAHFYKEFRKLCLSAGLSGKFGTHSLRRGGASFMSEIGIPLSDIKDRGMWSSACIFDYLLPSAIHKCNVDRLVAEKF